MSAVECLELLRLPTDAEASVGAILTAWRTAAAEIECDLRHIPLIEERSAQEQRHHELVQRYDKLWAAAVHLESSLHLRQPGQFVMPLSISFLPVAPAEPREAMLVHLVACAQRDNLCWCENSVYRLEPLKEAEGWRTHRATYQCSLDQWVWRCCDKETHYAFWAQLLKGTHGLLRTVCSQPQFPLLWRQADAFAWKDQVYVASKRRWEYGVAEQEIPSAASPVDGSDEFWAAVLGWPARGLTRYSVQVTAHLGPLECWLRSGLPALSCKTERAQLPLAEQLPRAVEASFRLDAERSGPMDKFLKRKR